MAKGSNFRIFCDKMWYAHLDECEAWFGAQPQYSSEEYFNRHKWFLKSLYKSCKGDISFLDKL